MAGKGGLRSTSFKKGNTAALGNDKTLRVSTWIDKELDREIGRLKVAELGEHEYEELMTNRQAIARKLVGMALHKSDQVTSMQAIREVLDRTEGKPKQSTELSGPNGGPILTEDVTEYTDAQLKDLIARSQ